jgi:hypothetical protein
VSEHICQFEVYYSNESCRPTCPGCGADKEVEELKAELKCYKEFADTYLENRYANLPKLRADLKELDNGRT